MNTVRVGGLVRKNGRSRQRELHHAGWQRLALCAVVATLLVWSGQLLLELFQVPVRVSGNQNLVSVSVEGQTRTFEVSAPVQSAIFVPAIPYQREYQIDGSDSTNSFTFQPFYFARFGTSIYYRFQAVLRDDASYSRWQDLVVADATGRISFKADRPAEGIAIRLPQPFIFSARLHRIETPRSLEFVEANGNAVQIDLNRNDRYLRVSEQQAGISRTLLSWFFPTDWRPPLAEVAWLFLRASAIALILVVVGVAIAALLPPGAIVIAQRRATLASGALAVCVLATSVAFTVVLFDRAPHVLDAVSYYFQAKVFASGALSAPAPAVPEAFPTPFTVVHGGRWFSQYPPGTAAFLAVGVIARLPWLVEPMFAAGAVLLTFAFALRQFGTKTALLGTTLMASSPFLLLQAGTFLSHVPAMFFVTLFIYAATRYLEAPAMRWVIMGAAALGVTFLTREIAAVLVGLPVGLTCAACALRQPLERRIRHAAAAAGCVLAAGLLYLFYDAALTGSLWELPRHLFSAADHLGFGEGVGFFGEHTVAAGLVNTDELLTSLNISLFGWPFSLALALMALPFIVKRPGRWELLHGAVVVSFIVVYVAYFYHGIILGPRYYFEALPSMVILAARGFVALVGIVAALLQGFGRGAAHQRAEKAALGLAALLLACNLIYFLPRQVALYRDFSGMPSGDGPVPVGFVRPGIDGRVPTLRGALVTTTNLEVYAVYLAALNCPRLDCDSVFAFVPSAVTDQRLQQAFPGRRWYFLRAREGRLTAEQGGAGGQQSP